MVRTRFLGSLALLLTACFGAAAAPAADLPQRLDRVFADSRLQQVDLSVLVTTGDGQRLYERRADRPLMPASNMKLVTAAAALRTWGPGYQFPTALYGDAPWSGGPLLTGNLYLKGLAHPTLDRGFIVRLAQKLHRLGLRRVTGGVVGAGAITCHPHPHPAQRDAQALHTALNNLGVTLGRAPGPGEIPAAGCRLLRWESDPTGALLTTMDKRSDNAIADGFMQSLRHAHGCTEITYDQLMQSLWRPLGLDLEGCRFVDGSGLSRQNRLTARFLVGLLRAMSQDERLGEPFRRSLPLAGQDGTLRLRMKDTAAVGTVRGKTGFLTGACTLSGYVERSGQTLCYSILMNNHRQGPEPMRDIQNRACIAMAEWLRAGGPALATGFSGPRTAP